MIRRRYLNSGIRVPELSSGYLTFRALEDNVLFSASGYHNFYYSINYGNWKKFEGTTEFLNFNDIIEWVGDKVDSSWILGTFESTGNFEIYGNLLSLLGHNISDEVRIDLSFYELFKDSENLISAANLLFPSYTGENCYEGMFKNCTSLLEAPQSLGTNENSTLCGYCYKSMFEGCTSLIIPPTEITGLANQNTGVYSNYCCNSMFANCTSLTYSPIIKCHVASGNKFSSMFYGCISLSEITCLDENPSSLENWVKNVASEGTFYKHPNSQWTIGDNGIPTGWEIINDYSKLYLTITSLEDDNTIKWNTTSSSYRKSISISTDNGNTWVSKTSSTSGTILATLNIGDKLLIKESNAYYYASNMYNYFSSTNYFNVEGNIMSLLWGDNFIGIKSLLSFSSFGYLFTECTKLISVENLVLPATTLSPYCYQRMFTGCTALTTAPELPATALAEGCYQGMFNSCTSLTSAPELPATTLANSCYYEMFRGCTSLTIVPELPATTLANSCYRQMFYNCSSLTTVFNILPALTLKLHCYRRMFYGCQSLVKAPELPASTSADYCYEGMFSGCKVLNYVKCLLTHNNSDTTSWLNQVAATGTFVKADDMTSWVTGPDSIPSGWTVINESEETQN